MKLPINIMLTDISKYAYTIWGGAFKRNRLLYIIYACYRYSKITIYYEKYKYKV